MIFGYWGSIMRKLSYVLLLVFLPLTLASDTQHRFKVYVDVEGDDETITRLLTSHLKRELRALGDVDIVGYDGDWFFTLRLFYLEHKTKGGVKMEHLSIAYITETRVPPSFFKDDFSHHKAVYPGMVGAATWRKERLQELCISITGDFNDDTLERVRSMRKSGK